MNNEETYFTSIDVVIPARNESKHIAACIESLLSQDYPAELYTIYIIDNGSSDETPKIVKRYPVVFLNLEVGTISAVLNKGIQQGNSELVAFIDAHCIVHENWLKNLSKYFIDPKIGGCAGKLNMAFENPRLQKTLKIDLKNPIKSSNYVLPMIPTGNAMYRRSALEQVGLFDEELYRNQDVELTWKVILAGYALAYAPEAIVTHYDMNTWCGYFIKQFKNGIGISQLLKKYELPQLAITTTLWNIFAYPSFETWLTHFFQVCGMSFESVSNKFGPKTLRKNAALNMSLTDIKQCINWDKQTEFKVSPDVAYWKDETDTVIITRIKPFDSFKFEGVSTVFWSLIEEGFSRVDAIRILKEKFNDVPESELSKDLDGFISDLIENKIILSAHSD